jgi:iron(III) transport system substrate-binding protein
MLWASAALAGTVFAAPLRAAVPEPTAVTPALTEAARREGRVSFYSSIDLAVSERVARAFEARHPGVAVRVERTGAERVYQRVAQEDASGIHAVDIVTSTDASHFVVWKRKGWLAPFVPEEAAQHLPPEHSDGDGMFATACATLNTIGYNTNLVKPQDAPKSYADLLDPRWRGKLVKAHPAYSGSILTTTYLMARELGWSYFEKLATQRVMQVQSAGDPPRKLALGERAVQVDGTDSIMILLKEQGQPVEVVHAAEGSPLIVTPSAVFRSAPNPNAARLFQSFLFSRECQELLVDTARHSFHAQVKEKPGRVPFASIKLMTGDPLDMESQAEDLKARYAAIFKV